MNNLKVKLIEQRLLRVVVIRRNSVPFS